MTPGGGRPPTVGRPGPGGGDRHSLPTPSLRRRLACMLYESLLLFGLSLIPAVLGAFFVAQTGKHGLLQNDHALRAFGLAVFAIYFVWFWATRGQTLAMQTWAIRVEREDGGRLGQGRALLRFVACCIGWCGPATIAVAILQPNPWPSLGIYAVGVGCWALLALAEPSRQFWHDRLCRTRLVDARKNRSGDSSVGQAVGAQPPRGLARRRAAGPR